MKTFNLEDYCTINKLVEKYKSNNLVATINWKRKVNSNINFLLKKWDIYDFCVNKDAYTGIVLECTTSNNNGVVIKIYPNFLSYRYIKEKFVIQNLNNYPQVKLLDYDDSLCAILLEKIDPGDYIEFRKDQKQITNMFISVFHNRKEIEGMFIPKEVMSVVEQTKNEFKKSSNYNYHNELISYLVKYQEYLYNKTFKNDKKYLLHGDIYYKNAIKSKLDIKIIDPVGYQDAFVFEYMPFLTYELFNNSNSNNYVNDYKMLLNYFASFTDVSYFHEAVFVFLVKQLVPSIYEANDNYERANKFLNLIKVLYLDSNNCVELEKIKI